MDINEINLFLISCMFAVKPRSLFSFSPRIIIFKNVHILQYIHLPETWRNSTCEGIPSYFCVFFKLFIIVWHMCERGECMTCVNTCALLNCMETCCKTTQSLFSCCFPPTTRLAAASALPCPGCWPWGLALASCWFARPRSTRRSSSTMLPGPAAQTSSPWVRVPLCQSSASLCSIALRDPDLLLGQELSALAV